MYLRPSELCGNLATGVSQGKSCKNYWEPLFFIETDYTYFANENYNEFLIWSNGLKIGLTTYTGWLKLITT